MSIKTEHPHIVKDPNILGGSAVIRGTRVPIRAVVGYYKIGLSVEEILEGFPKLTAAQIYDALSYYHDHPEEIDQEIEQNKIEHLTEKFALRVGDKGQLIFK
jgi:uncharacterized protein (DUF433 family)